MVIVDERYSEIKYLYDWFRDHSQGSIAIIGSGTKGKWLYPYSKDLKKKLLEVQARFGVEDYFSRVYIVSFCMKSRVYFLADKLYKIGVEENDLVFSEVDMRGKRGRGSPIFGVQFTKQVFLDATKALSGLLYDVKRNVEDIYEFLSLLNVIALFGGGSRIVNFGDIATETQMFIDKVSGALRDEELGEANKIYKMVSQAKELTRNIVFAFGNYNVVRIEKKALEFWNKKLGYNEWEKLGTLFVSTDPLYRTRDGIMGVIKDEIINVGKLFIECPLLVGFILAQPRKIELELLREFIKNVEELFVAYFSRLFTFTKDLTDIQLIIEEGFMPIFIGRR